MISKNEKSTLQVETIGDKQMRSVGDLDDYTQSLLQLAQIHMAKSFSVEAKRYKRGNLSG